MEKPVSSLAMVALAVVPVRAVLAPAGCRTMLKDSSTSTWSSVLTWTVMVAVLAPAAKLTVPEGRSPLLPRRSWPVMKSPMEAELAPPGSWSSQSMSWVRDRSPPRVTVKVKSV